MVWPILISPSVTPGAFCAAAGIAIAPPSSKQPNKIRSIARPPLVSSDVSTISLYRCDAIGPGSSLPGLTPQVGFNRLAVLKTPEFGQARIQMQSIPHVKASREEDGCVGRA